MNIEDQYIQDQFINNFINKCDNPIVIYGTGIHTEKLLANIKTERVIGLMDAKHTGEIMFGKKVLNYDEVALIHDVIIVIIARNAVIDVIYRRIEAFVKKHQISVYDINGAELLAHSFSEVDKDCFCIKEKELKKCIDDVEVVSFDIFDTLLCRSVMRPSDVFDLIDCETIEKEYTFSIERKRAEKELEQLIAPTIFEIYEQIGNNTGETQQELLRLMHLEIETEKKILRKRDKMCEILQFAIEKGKKVLLISDMYFTKEIMTEILKKFGICGYSELYISCEYHKSKAMGLYEVVRDKEGIADSWLHVGDNYISDIEIPKQDRIKTFRIYSTTEMLEESIYSEILEFNNSLEENIVMAQFAAEAYNNPFKGFNKIGKLNINDSQHLAKLIFAPIIFKYMIWLIKHLYRDKIDLILFPSRDGYILKKIYELICTFSFGIELPQGKYLYTSRRAAMVSAAKTIDDISRISEFPGDKTIDVRARNRFDINTDCEYMSDEFISAALVRCAWERNNYLKYLEKYNLDSYNNIAMVDFVSIGSIHEALQRLLGKNIHGYYFLRRKPDTEAKALLEVDALYGTYGDFQMDVNVYRYYYFMEMILTSYEPSLKCIDGEGQLCFYKENRTGDVLDTIKKMHRGIYQYCEEMIPIIYSIDEWNASIGVYDKLLSFFSKDYIDIQQGVIDGIENVDEFMEKKIADINR